MKLISLILLSFLPLAPPTPLTTPFDEYGNICFEDEQARLDNFAINLQNDENLVGYIIVHAGKQSCLNEAKYRGNRARNWVLKRGVKVDRVIFIDAGYADELQTRLVLAPKDRELPKPTKGLDKDSVSIHKCVDKVFARKFCPTANRNP